MHETNKMWTRFGIIYKKFGHGQLFVKRERGRERAHLASAYRYCKMQQKNAAICNNLNTVVVMLLIICT